VTLPEEDGMAANSSSPVPFTAPAAPAKRDRAANSRASRRSADPAHTGTVTTRAAGPFIEIDHPDGTVTAMGAGHDGQVTIPGQGPVWDEIGITKIGIDASGNVTEIQHGIFTPDHSGICPLL
jgi:hypothetical protein